MLHLVTWSEHEYAIANRGGIIDLHVRGLSTPIRGSLDSRGKTFSSDQEYYCVMLAYNVCGNNAYTSSKGLLLEPVAEGVYKRIGVCDSSLAPDKPLISERRYRRMENPSLFKHERKPYKRFPFEVHYSPDGCETRITRGASAQELQDREADTEEVVFTII